MPAYCQAPQVDISPYGCFIFEQRQADSGRGRIKYLRSIRIFADCDETLRDRLQLAVTSFFANLSLHCGPVINDKAQNSAIMAIHLNY